MGDRCGMSISADSPLDETLNRGPLALLLRRQYELPFGINTVQFSFFFIYCRRCVLRHEVCVIDLGPSVPGGIDSWMVSMYHGPLFS